MKRKAIILPGLLIIAVLLSSCVSTTDFEAMVNERDNVIMKHDTALQEKTALEEEKASLEEQLDTLQMDNDQLKTMLMRTEVQKVEESERAEQAEEDKMLVAQFAAQAEEDRRIAAEKAEKAEEEKRIAAEKAEKAEAALAQQENVYSRLQETFAQEQEANQVKIEMLKSGIKVNLANEILFSSGSSTLNPQGQEVLKRAAADLNDNPYQILVAGFTDNVAISGKLKEKYPSNWELAGARAASVVRLLEGAGVPSEKLLMISLGENKPVESNESAEGRAKNRRIEIMLRPEPVTLD
ncbi:flagellar motor protein MotB [Nitrospirota bacterium]